MGRGKRKAILSDGERGFLQGKIKFTSKQKWTFRKSILSRLENSIVDTKLIWDFIKKDRAMESMALESWDKFYSLAENIHPRHYSQLHPHNLGRVRFKALKKKGKKRRTRVYWFDEMDDKFINYQSQAFPFHQLREIRPKGVKNTLIDAFKIEYKFHSRKTPIDPKDLKKVVIPRNESKALGIYQIEKRMEHFKEKIQGKSRKMIG